MSVIANDPLVTDICESIRAKIALNSTLTGILGSSPLRVYRTHPPKQATYPIVIITRVGKSSIGAVAVDYYFNLTVHDKSIDATNRDLIEKEFQGIFDDPNCLTDFSKNNTKIDQVIFIGGGTEFWDDKNKMHILPITIQVKARRKIPAV